MFNNQNQNGIHLEINQMFNDIKLSDVIILDKSVNTNFAKYSTSVQLSSDDFSLIREHIEKDIASTISRKCIKEIIDNSKNEYLDLTKYVNDIELDRLATNELIDYIIERIEHEEITTKSNGNAPISIYTSILKLQDKQFASKLDKQIGK